MARTCSICTHLQRDEIDEAIVRGVSYRYIAIQFGIGKDAVARHKASHLPATLALATKAQETIQAGDLLGEVTALRDRSYGILDKAEESEDLNLALRAIREVRGCVDLQAKMLIALADRMHQEHDYENDSQWWTMRLVLMKALDPYPEARMAVAAALIEVGHVSSV